MVLLDKAATDEFAIHELVVDFKDGRFTFQQA